MAKKIIGRTEKVSFPDLDIFEIDAKVDTGAYTSSLHCHHIELVNGKKEVTFFVLDPSHPEFNKKKITHVISDIRNIRSSNGLTEERIVIKTIIRMCGEEYPVELSLSDRSEMRYPLLLGRKFIKNKFIVDVSKTYTGDH